MSNCCHCWQMDVTNQGKDENSMSRNSDVFLAILLAFTRPNDQPLSAPSPTSLFPFAYDNSICSTSVESLCDKQDSSATILSYGPQENNVVGIRGTFDVWIIFLKRQLERLKGEHDCKQIAQLFPHCAL